MEEERKESLKEETADSAKEMRADTGFQSGEILLEIAKSEYQNEHSRTSVIDSKVGITLPIIATYFFLVLQFDSMKSILTSSPNMQNIATIIFSVVRPLIYIMTIIFAGIALVYLFRAIISQSYMTVDPCFFNDKDTMSRPKEVFSAVMVTYYVRALEYNRATNDTRIIFYKRGWIFTMISLGLFVSYIFLTR